MFDFLCLLLSVFVMTVALKLHGREKERETERGRRRERGTVKERETER